MEFQLAKCRKKFSFLLLLLLFLRLDDCSSFQKGRSVEHQVQLFCIVLFLCVLQSAMALANTEIVYEGWLVKSPPTKRIWRAVSFSLLNLIRLEKCINVRNLLIEIFPDFFLTFLA